MYAATAAAATGGPLKVMPALIIKRGEKIKERKKLGRGKKLPREHRNRHRNSGNE